MIRDHVYFIIVAILKIVLIKQVGWATLQVHHSSVLAARMSKKMCTSYMHSPIDNVVVLIGAVDRHQVVCCSNNRAGDQSSGAGEVTGISWADSVDQRF